MQRLLMILFFSLLLAGTGFATDIIVTKTGARIEGKVLKRTDDQWAFRRLDGSITIFKTADISQFIRGKYIYDFEKKIQFIVEKRRPFLPFLVLSAGTGYYAVQKFQDYRKHRDEAEADNLGPDYQNLQDESKKDMAFGIISGLFCAGSIYIALRPVEVKTALSTFKLSATPSRLNLAIEF
ncbi:hypothetical protein JXO52_04180 [bacterium]|nr:hypothetical protein [bacterium]